MENIEQILEYALSKPPSSAGLRLRSERDLAALFGTDHFRVRNSLSELVRKGVLVRRHGSGTYVRKVPKVSRKLSPTSLKIAPDALFATSQPKMDSVSSLDPIKHHQLQLSLWTDFTAETSLTRKALLRGITDQIERTGHGLTIHSICGDDGKMLAADELAERLKAHPSDGYLVGTWTAELFQQAIGKHHKPIVYFSDSKRQIRHEPVVMLDSLEAVHRGVRLLAEQGHERIGLIGLDLSSEPEESSEPFRKAYERAMNDVGLSYSAAEFSQANVQDSVAACRRLLAGPTPPEALVVADDIVLNGVAETLTADSITLGKDLAVVTLSNVSSRLPKGIEWSRLEFNIEGLGEVVVNTLLGLLQTAGWRADSSAIYAKWKPGRTHIMKRK